MATIEDILAIDDPTSFAIAMSNLVFPDARPPDRDQRMAVLEQLPAEAEAI